MDCDELLAEVNYVFAKPALIGPAHAWWNRGVHRSGLQGASGRGYPAVSVKHTLIGPAHAW
jgi:hypothetical protein